MRSPKVITAVLLYLVGLMLAAANLWFTAARSTIPIALDGVISSTAMGREKHAGLDDVFWIRLGSQPAIQVDEPVYRAVAIGQRLEKPRWSKQLRVGGHTFALTWSQDFRGMIAAMPIVLGIVAATMAAATWNLPQRPGS
ncbi:MAG TPA: hypothetical protein VMP01_29710 [Pirellulaceae bacterium]|nr:hypothetical protein [Pirellulaceae bacterium]